MYWPPPPRTRAPTHTHAPARARTLSLSLSHSLSSEILYYFGNRINITNTGSATGHSPALVPPNSTWPISPRTSLIYALTSSVTFYLTTVWEVFYFRFYTGCYFAGIWTVCPLHHTFFHFTAVLISCDLHYYDYYVIPASQISNYMT